MTTEQNKAIIRRMFDEAWNRGELGVTDELLAPGHRYANAPPGTPGDAEALKATIQRLRRAVPDLHMTIEAQIAEGERVATCYRSTGTHQGELQTPLGTLPPSGRRLAYTGVVVHRFRDGRCEETWINVDLLGILQQLGAIQAPAPAAP